MSAPSNVNANVSHPKTHRLSVFDGAPRSSSARKQTNRKREARAESLGGTEEDVNVK